MKEILNVLINLNLLELDHIEEVILIPLYLLKDLCVTTQFAMSLAFEVTKVAIESV